LTGKVEFGVVGGGFAYRADILAWSRRPVRTLPGGLHVILTLKFLTGPCQEPNRTVSAVGSPPGPRQY
jgi:hypothetical protein